MDIQLVSRDTELCRLCREVVAEFSRRFAISVAGPDDLETQRQVLQRMQNSIQRLTRMASAMPLLSAGAQVKTRHTLQRGDLAARLNQSLYEIAPIADDKYISITPELEPCDACPYTPRSGSIEIRRCHHFWERRSPDCPVPPPVERRRLGRAGFSLPFKPNSYRADVRDSGAAIPEENLHRIFEEYTSFADGHNRSGVNLQLVEIGAH
jgi:signal transduction histidine kinase